MNVIKLPPSITDREALKIVQSQGFNTIISIVHTPDGSKIINAN